MKRLRHTITKFTDTETAVFSIHYNNNDAFEDVNRWAYQGRPVTPPAQINRVTSCLNHQTPTQFESKEVPELITNFADAFGAQEINYEHKIASEIISFVETTNLADKSTAYDDQSEAFKFNTVDNVAIDCHRIVKLLGNFADKCRAAKELNIDEHFNFLYSSDEEEIPEPNALPKYDLGANTKTPPAPRKRLLETMKFSTPVQPIKSIEDEHFQPIASPSYSPVISEQKHWWDQYSPDDLIGNQEKVFNYCSFSPANYSMSPIPEGFQEFDSPNSQKTTRKRKMYELDFNETENEKIEDSPPIKRRKLAPDFDRSQSISPRSVLSDNTEPDRIIGKKRRFFETMVDSPADILDKKQKRSKISNYMVTPLIELGTAQNPIILISDTESESQTTEEESEDLRGLLDSDSSFQTDDLQESESEIMENDSNDDVSEESDPETESDPGTEQEIEDGYYDSTDYETNTDTDIESGSSTNEEEEEDDDIKDFISKKNDIEYASDNRGLLSSSEDEYDAESETEEEEDFDVSEYLLSEESD